MNNNQLNSATGTVFLTGGSGYIGRNLIRHFLAKGYTIRALTRSHASAEVVSRLGATPILGDINSKNLRDEMSGSSILIHAAADTDHGYGGRAQYDNNVEGTRNIFQSARDAGIQKALLISSESVLLDGQPLVKANENHPLPRKPAGSYSRTKGLAEQVSLELATDAFEVIIIRPRFVWGKDDTTALPQLVKAAQSGKFAWIDGGNYLTSSTHITNLCHGIELALMRGKNKEIYFITDGHDQTFRELAGGLLQSQGIVPPEKTVPRALLKTLATVGTFLEKTSRGRISGPINMQTYATSAVEVTLDISKAETELGYAPVISLAEGMEELSAISSSKGLHSA